MTSSHADRAANALATRSWSSSASNAARFSAMHKSRMLRIELAVTPEAAGDASDIFCTAKYRLSDFCCGGASSDPCRVVVEKAAKF